MALADFRQTGFKVIKLISTVLILSAIGLELGNLYVSKIGSLVPNTLQIVLWVAHLALIAHLIEGMIAAFYAPAQGKAPFRYGIYTFFVGTVGLMELFEYYLGD